LLNDLANFVNKYKTKYEMSIFFIIRRSKTIITIFEIIVLTSLVDIIVLVLLSKKRDRSSKITKNALISKKKIDCLRLRLLQTTRKTTTLKHYFDVIIANVQELITINYSFKHNIKRL